jgi:phage baseplate assembly protein W
VAIVGIRFPFDRGDVSFPATATDEEVIADNILRILQTPRGSRVMRPGVGSDVYLFVFDSIGPVLRARITAEVRRAISVGEPRANVLNVIVNEQLRTDGDRNVVVIVDYEVNLRPSSVSVTF